MEVYQGVLWADRTELGHLVEQNAVEGPFDAQNVSRERGFFTGGLRLCYREAAEIARKERYDFAVAENSMEVGRSGSVDVRFYRFAKW